MFSLAEAFNRHLQSFEPFIHTYAQLSHAKVGLSAHKKIKNKLMRIIFGLILAVFGFVFVLKSEWFLENFGTIEFAEKHLGTSGGSRAFYKLLGLGLILFGLFITFNLYGGIVQWIGVNLFGAFIPS